MRKRDTKQKRLGSAVPLWVQRYDDYSVRLSDGTLEGRDIYFTANVANELQKWLESTRHKRTH